MSDTLARPVPAQRSLPSRLRQYYALTKPRVVQLIVFCAVIGMLLATPGLARLARWRWPPRVGIWLVAGAAAAFNCLVEQHIDASMARTAWRPTANGRAHRRADAAVLGRCCAPPAARCCTFAVNPLTMWLTFATFVGYAVVYTVMLKPLTPQNIVIGGASGAMPPVLGWAAMRGEVGPEALILCLIIFLWTPPHFWALALYRAEDYRRPGLPMLPVTHGSEFTRLQVLLYTLVLFAATLLPFVSGMSGWIYLAAAVVLGRRASSATPGSSWRDYSDALARKTFRFSILYLSLLFAALLVDHYLGPAVRVTRLATPRRFALARCRACSPAATSSAGAQRRSRRSRSIDITGAEYARELVAARRRRQAAHAGRLQGQGHGRLLRLHPVPRRLPDDAGRAGRRSRSALGADGDTRAGRLRHRRSGARHAARS